MHDHLIGCLLGTAVGDAIGLPYEGLSRRRGAKLLGPPTRHRFLCGRGMVSDDTEHACMAAQALIVSGCDAKLFQRALARNLRRWVLGFPAGAGLATLKASVRLWLGIAPERSGVRSAGNGPAMRAPILGVAIEDIVSLREFVRASSRITHNDPKAEDGAFTVALAAHVASRNSSISPDDYLATVECYLDPRAAELIRLLGKSVASAKAGESTEAFAAALGLVNGVTGYTLHTVPVAVQAWLLYRHDCRSAIESVIRCGGDTDSTAAIVGGIVGAAVGPAGIPADWLQGLMEWPRTTDWMVKLAAQLSECVDEEKSANPNRLPVVGVLLRNMVFLAAVLVHGFRRLAPPY